MLQLGSWPAAPLDSARALPAAFEAGAPTTPHGNRLVAALPELVQARLLNDLQPVWLRAGDMAMEGPCQHPHAMFPVGSILSMQSVMRCGSAVEFAGVGNEGWAGVSLVLGGSRAPWRAMVQASGLAYRLPLAPLLREFKRGEAFSIALLGYIGTMVAQMATISACNRRHSLEQQLSRWILIADDRLGGKALLITHEVVAGILGVRREAVSLAAGRLQRGGLIESRRGQIRVLRRDLLLGRSCDCYAVVRDEYDRSTAHS